MLAPILQCLLILLVGNYTCRAILVGDNLSSRQENYQGGNSTLSIHHESNRSNSSLQVAESKPSDQIDQPSSNTNTTFYYDPNEFLINPSKSQGTAKERVEKEASLNKSLPVQASHAMTSARNGRMLDLDAFVGDFAASRANKERSQTGNRQSRYLSPHSSPALDVGNGKKLHIQGFIPIVGLKDVTEEESSGSGSGGSNNNENVDPDQTQSMKHRLQASAGNDLPYAASSIGHASFGVQRYLNNDLQPSTSNQQQQQVDAKFSGASVVESIKKPLKKLTGYVSNEQADNVQKQPQNCLCMPFYMCKNGYISESSLGKSQIQQLILQQQQQQQQPLKQLDQQQIEMKSGQLMISPQAPPMIQQPPQEQQQSDKQLQFADSYVPVDERSFEREVMKNSSEQQSVENQPDNGTENENQGSQISLPTEDQSMLNISSLSSPDSSNQQSNDYSQEILGRMLGLKSPSRSSLVSPGLQSGQNSGGVCGLLRSCCNIPIHMFPTQQDLANERFMAQYGNSPMASQQIIKYQQAPQQINFNKVYSSVQSQDQPLQQQVLTAQRYQQQQQQQQQQQTRFGLPSSNQMSRMQPLNSPFSVPLSSSYDTTSLAHRSNQFQSQLSRYQPQQQQVAQYTRAAPSNQQLQTFQQPSIYPQQQAKAMPLPMAPVNLNNQQLQPAQSMRQLTGQGLGTRKILEGRCGQRQSAGINGRVQNLQYHDSSADFGEYPAQAAILKRLGGSDSLFVCGGTLISQYWVATAAHCIKKHNFNDLKVRLGEWDVHRDDEFYPFVEKEIRDLVVHPDFVAGNLVNDIALIRLDSPVDPSLPHVNPACLPTIDETFSRQRCWVTGWGKDSFGQRGSFQSVLREVELPVVGQSECEQALRQTRLGPHYRLHSGFICAGGEGGKDACEGDGGSGLYCVQDGVIKVAGLVSWGIGCGQAGVPGIYVNLAHYRPWIENIISVDEDIYSSYSNMINNSLISERSNSTSELAKN